MIYIPNESTDCYFNLALEECVLTAFDPEQSYLLLWRNDNTIVVGKHQNTAEEINAAYVKANGIRVVRRMSGGGAVYHDLGNLNYTLIQPRQQNAAFDFQAFAAPVVCALAAMGVPAEYNGRNDLTVDGKKFSGSAQYVSGSKVLHHGTLLFSSNLDVVADALQVREEKLASHAVKSVRSRVTNLAPYLPASMTIETFQAALLAHLFPQGVVSRTLTAAELTHVQRLREQKYAAWEWNYGVSPPYTVRREARFAGGIISLYLDVRKGKICSARFYGDFFGADDLTPLEQGLIGTSLQENALCAALKRLNATAYFKQIREEELLSLFL